MRLEQRLGHSKLIGKNYYKFINFTVDILVFQISTLKNDLLYDIV